MKGYTIQHSIELLEKNQGGGSGGPASASDVSFNNTGTGLVATNVQGAITEVETNLKNKGFGSVIVDTDLATFQAASDTYTANFDGLLVISVLASDVTPRLSVNNSDGATYTFTNGSGASGSFTIPVKTGDVITISNISSCSVTQINKYPLNIPTVTNTRKSKSK